MCVQCIGKVEKDGKRAGQRICWDQTCRMSQIWQIYLWKKMTGSFKRFVKKHSCCIVQGFMNDCFAFYKVFWIRQTTSFHIIDTFSSLKEDFQIIFDRSVAIYPFFSGEYFLGKFIWINLFTFCMSFSNSRPGPLFNWCTSWAVRANSFNEATTKLDWLLCRH